jgi:tetratricopeptide (TPR) repeat protein
MNAPLLVAIFFTFAFVVLFSYIRVFRKPKRLQKIWDQIKAGNTRSSIRELKVIIIRQGGTADTHFLLAECYRREGNYQMAVVEYRYCLNLHKKPFLTDEQEIREDLLECYTKLNKEEDALRELIELVRIEPKNAGYLFKTAIISYNRGSLEQAVTYFDRTIRVDPSHAESLSYLGMIMYHANQLKEAFVYLSRAVNINPRIYRTHYFLGRLYTDEGDFPKAISYFDTAQISPDFRIRAYIQKGNCYKAIDDIENAVDEYKKAISSSKGRNQNLLLTAKYALADVYENQGKISEALVQWEDIHKVNTSYRDVGKLLEKYAVLRTDDNIKDFLISPLPVFEGLCIEIVNFLGYEIQEIQHVTTSITNVIATTALKKMRNIKPHRVYIKILRDSINIDLKALKDLIEEAKIVHCVKAIVISPVKYSSQVKNYSSTRQISLIDGTKLADILNAIKGEAEQV